MKKKKAFITGINGQDGSFLAELLLAEGDYEVFGTLRRHSVSESQDYRIAHLGDKINTDYCDITNANRLNKLLSLIKPTHIFNLAAQSHVKVSFDEINYTLQTNAIGVANILEAYHFACPEAKFYQASSSEMFGNSIDPDGFQRETTPMHPVSPYGCSKLFGYAMVRHYRRAYRLFASNGILFNHESERRGSAFVTAKIAKTVAKIHLGLARELRLGNIQSHRDWGHSQDYVRAMLMILEHPEPDDFVVSTGETHSVEEFCKKAFEILGMDYREFVVIDGKFLRAEELNLLKGDSSKARQKLGWLPQISFDELVHRMVMNWVERLSSKNNYENEKFDEYYS